MLESERMVAPETQCCVNMSPVHYWSLLVVNILLTLFTSCSIGGDPDFICKALQSELTWRRFQDYRIHRTTSSWHVVVFPDSNISNAPMSKFYFGNSPGTEGWPVATTLRPTQQNPLSNQQAAVPQQSHQTNQQALFSQQNPYTNQQPVLTQNNPMGSYGRVNSSVVPSQQSQLTTPIPGNFRSGGGSTVPFPQEQFYSQTPQQGSVQGFAPNNGPAQGNYPCQGNNMMPNQGSGASMGFLPQVHRPIFDKYGYIVGEEGNTNASNMYSGNMTSDNMTFGNSAPGNSASGNMNPSNMYGSNMYDANLYSSNVYSNKTVDPAQPVPLQGPQQQVNRAQQPYNPGMNDPSAAALAQSFYNFVQDRVDQEEGYQDEDDHGQGEGDENECAQESDQAEDEGDQDEGVALGNASSNNTDSTNDQRARLPKPAVIVPPMNLLTASRDEPHRFTDNTGMNLCDYCGREGHEADACIRWDPVHFDKPVCTACNNDQHSLDECPKFRVMSMSEKQDLLLGKGARRPGVRSDYHAWTNYARHGGNYNNEGGFPLTRLFLRNLSLDKDNGAMLQNVWKVWDYARGVPDQFLDSRAESLAGDPTNNVDERFMGGEHELGWRMPVPQNVSHPGPSEFPRQRMKKPVPQFRKQAPQEAPQEGDEAEL